MNLLYKKGNGKIVKSLCLIYTFFSLTNSLFSNKFIKNQNVQGNKISPKKKNQNKAMQNI